MLANIQRSLTVTGNKRIRQKVYSSQPDFLPIEIVYMITNASVYCGSEFELF